MEFIGLLWTEVVTRPMTNGLVFFYSIFGHNFGVAIIAFTILVRLLMYPLTVKQLRATKAMQALQPRIKDLQEKHKNDKQRQQREQMKLFKEAGVSPLGCLGPIIIQIPIWIGLYSAIRATLADTPEQLVSLSSKVYSWLPFVDQSVPLGSHFLWMDLGKPDPSPIVMPVLVGASMWVTQKMSTLPNADPRQQSMTNMMNWMWPLMFGVWTLTFPSGLAVYWVISNVISIALQYRVTGWGALKRQPAPAPAPAPAAVAPRSPRAAPVEQRREPQAVNPSAPAGSGGSIGGFLKRVFLGSQPATQPSRAEGKPAEGAVEVRSSPQERVANGEPGSDRKNGRRSYRQSGPAAGGRSRRPRGRRRR